jgi:hypothetical protein
LSIVDVVVVAVDVTVTVATAADGRGGVGRRSTGATKDAEATGTATAPAIPECPTVLIAPAKMMLRRFFFMVLVPFRNNVTLVVLTI